MVDDRFLAGLALGGLIVGTPVAIATWLLSENGYREGLRGKKMVWIGLFGILGRTEDGIYVSVPYLEREREVRSLIQGLEWRVYDLEQTQRELKAAHTVSQSRIKVLEDEIEKLRVQMERLRNEVSRRVPELSERLDYLIKRLEPLTQKQRARNIYST